MKLLKILGIIVLLGVIFGVFTAETTIANFVKIAAFVAGIMAIIKVVKEK